MTRKVRTFSFKTAVETTTVVEEEGYCALEWPRLGLTTCGHDEDSAMERLPEALQGLADTYAEEPNQEQAFRAYLDSHGAEYTLIPVDEMPDLDGIFPLNEAGLEQEGREVRCGFSFAVAG